MAYRYTNTDKWNDSWFSELKQFEKLLFIYLCDNCDIAGFFELNFKRIESDLGTSKETILGAFKGLARGLILSNSSDCIYVRNFLKHQKNLPLNEKNNAHLGIIKRFESYKKKFEIENIESFINQDIEPLPRGYGNGNGKCSGNDINIKTWKNDFDIYKKECKEAFIKFDSDKSIIEKQERLNPNVDIKLTIEKAYDKFWSTEAGWKNKKKSGYETIDWDSTIKNSISTKSNIVYKTKLF